MLAVGHAEDYERDGHLVVSALVQPSEVAALRGEAARIRQGARGLVAWIALGDATARNGRPSHDVRAGKGTHSATFPSLRLEQGELAAGGRPRADVEAR